MISEVISEDHDPRGIHVQIAVKRRIKVRFFELQSPATLDPFAALYTHLPVDVHRFIFYSALTYI